LLSGSEKHNGMTTTKVNTANSLNLHFSRDGPQTYFINKATNVYKSHESSGRFKQITDRSEIGFLSGSQSLVGSYAVLTGKYSQIAALRRNVLPPYSELSSPRI